MLIEVLRDESNTNTTTGCMLVDEGFFAYTLEDKVRDKKIKHHTAIPDGQYECVVTYSPRFKRDMILVKGVKGFSGIRIHAGNTHEDTSGCILVAKHVKPGVKIWGDSRALEAMLTDLVRKAGKADLIVHPHRTYEFGEIKV